MSIYSPGRDIYESDGSIVESQNSYGSQEEEDDSNNEREYGFERYALQGCQPPGELILPLLSENKELRKMNKSLIYKVCALKVLQKDLTSEIDELKDALISLSLKNDALICMNKELRLSNRDALICMNEEELRLSNSEENAKTSFNLGANLGAYGINLRLNRETRNKQRMKQKFRE